MKAELKADLKAENAELRADIREIRQLLYKNVVGTGDKENNIGNKLGVLQREPISFF